MIIYLDTPIIRDCLMRRKKESIEFLKFLGKNGVKCMTGIFTDLELLDIEQESQFFFREMQNGRELNEILINRKNKNLNEEELNGISERLENFYTEYDSIEKVALVDDGWQWALDISMTSNIRSEDALHLATAIGEKCDMLITNDTHFTKEGNKFLENSDKLEKPLVILNPTQAKKVILEKIKKEK